jgi:hypothetical protein
MNAAAASRPGIATDALTRASFAIEEPRDGYTIVRSPERPDYWFGNCLVLDSEPAPERYGDWIRAHAEAFAGTPVKRRVVLWENDARKDLEPYDGPLARDSVTIFTTRRSPGRATQRARIAPLASQRDWDAALTLVKHERIEAGSPEQVDFATWRFNGHHRDADAGKCRVWGAWSEDDLVAFAGLYANDEWARFITPITKAEHRRRGLFSALANRAMSQTLALFPGATIVIGAEKGSETLEKLYEGLGFRAAGEQHALVAQL